MCVDHLESRPGPDTGSGVEIVAMSTIRRQSSDDESTPNHVAKSHDPWMIRGVKIVTLRLGHTVIWPEGIVGTGIVTGRPNSIDTKAEVDTMDPYTIRPHPWPTYETDRQTRPITPHVVDNQVVVTQCPMLFSTIAAIWHQRCEHMSCRQGMEHRNNTLEPIGSMVPIDNSRLGLVEGVRGRLTRRRIRHSRVLRVELSDQVDPGGFLCVWY